MTSHINDQKFRPKHRLVQSDTESETYIQIQIELDDARS